MNYYFIFWRKNAMASFIFDKKEYLNYLSNCTVTKRNGFSDTFSMEKILTGIDKSARRSGRDVLSE